jgi:hypothetical protein
VKKCGKHYKTQWTGQYGVAHELARRGYLVTFTTGNAPSADLFCQSPEGHLFSVQVKSLSSKTFFLYQQSLVKPNPSLFFVFVFIPSNPEVPIEYYVLTNEEFLKLTKKENERLKEAEKARGKPYASFSPGIAYRTLNAHSEFLGAWSNLPA